MIVFFPWYGRLQVDEYNQSVILLAVRLSYLLATFYFGNDKFPENLEKRKIALVPKENRQTSFWQVMGNGILDISQNLPEKQS